MNKMLKTTGKTKKRVISEETRQRMRESRLRVVAAKRRQKHQVNLNEAPTVEAVTVVNGLRNELQAMTNKLHLAESERDIANQRVKETDYKFNTLMTRHSANERALEIIEKLVEELNNK
jgi:hypothetical protein